MKDTSLIKELERDGIGCDKVPLQEIGPGEVDRVPAFANFDVVEVGENGGLVLDVVAVKGVGADAVIVSVVGIDTLMYRMAWL